VSAASDVRAWSSHDPDRLDDLQPLDERDGRDDPLGRLADLVGDHTRDQRVAALSRLAQHVEVTDVEEIEHARYVTDDRSHAHASSKCLSISLGDFTPCSPTTLIQASIHTTLRVPAISNATRGRMQEAR
jgi:hypothetical protein